VLSFLMCNPFVLGGGGIMLGVRAVQATTDYRTVNSVCTSAALGKHGNPASLQLKVSAGGAGCSCAYCCHLHLQGR
jgi:hypothetical protein